LQVGVRLAAYMMGWEAKLGMRLYFPVACDGRRDIWEQAERVMKMNKFATEETECNAIVISLGSGSLLL
jgi:hypothetical protein